MIRLFIHPVNGSDDSVGTQDSPLKTLSGAIQWCIEHEESRVDIVWYDLRLDLWRNGLGGES